MPKNKIIVIAFKRKKNQPIWNSKKNCWGGEEKESLKNSIWEIDIGKVIENCFQKILRILTYAQSNTFVLKNLKIEFYMNILISSTN